VITGWSATLDALLKADRAVVLIKVYYYGGRRRTRNLRHSLRANVRGSHDVNVASVVASSHRAKSPSYRDRGRILIRV
jgi:hypothetical protein